METRTCAKCSKRVDVPDYATPIVDAVGKPLCDACFDDWRATAEVNAPPKPVVEQRATRYMFTEAMGEISGFGGGYEQTCRNMLAAGLDWLDEHPNADPRFECFEGIYGVLADDNDDAKALSKVVVAGADGDCTGAMHHAVVSHCLFICKNGWERYVEEMSKREEIAASDGPTRAASCS